MESSVVLRIQFGHWRRQLLARSAVLSMAGFVAHRFGAGAWPLYGMFLLFAALLSLFIVTEFNPIRRTVRRSWSLLGVIPIFSRVWPMDDFSGIRLVLKEGTDNQRMWWIALRRSAGRELQIQWYEDTKLMGTQALVLARSLADVTGLRIGEDVS
jgi:hypothetical protein